MWSKEETRCCNHVESKGEATHYKYSSFRIVLKHSGRNLSKSPYSCLPCGKLTYHIKCIHFCKSYLNAFYTELFSHHSPPTIFHLGHYRVEISVIGPVSKGSRVSRCPKASAELGHWNFPRQVTPTNGIWVLQRLSVCWDAASGIILYTRLSVQKQL